MISEVNNNASISGNKGKHCKNYIISFRSSVDKITAHWLYTFLV